MTYADVLDAAVEVCRAMDLAVDDLPYVARLLELARPGEA